MRTLVVNDARPMQIQDGERQVELQVVEYRILRFSRLD